MPPPMVEETTSMIASCEFFIFCLHGRAIRCDLKQMARLPMRRRNYAAILRYLPIGDIDKI